MKVRDSGMPDEDYWESLFDVPLVLDRLGIDGTLGAGVELGCGYGTFTMPVASRIQGTLATFDIEDSMVARTRTRSAGAGLRNVVCEKWDVLKSGFPVASGSQDGAVVAHGRGGC